MAARTKAGVCWCMKVLCPLVLQHAG